MTSSRSGFSLLEMAVVLVIIGLLIGGVFISQSLIRTAELQTVIQERSTYITAITEFTDKYNQLPGDFSKAAAIWGTDPLGCPGATYLATPRETTETCSGDGNGRIGSSNNAGVASDSQEWWRAWQHLSNAGLIEGRYTGTRGNTGADSAEIDINVPSSDIEGAGWTLLYLQNIADTADLYGEPGGGWGHLLIFGAQGSSSYTYGKVLLPEYAFSVDKKMDDGKPAFGNIRTWRKAKLARCTTNDTSAAAQTYDLANDAIGCSFIFITGL